MQNLSAWRRRMSSTRKTLPRLVRGALVVCAGAIPVLLSVQAAPTAAAAEEAESAELPLRHQEFLRLTEALASSVEREVFLQLDADYQRDAFIRRFWQEKDPFPETPRNEWQEQLEHNSRLATERGFERGDVRSRAMLLHGAPARVTRTTCDILRPLELWTYNQSLVIPGNFALVFDSVGGQRRLWSPERGLSELILGLGAGSSRARPDSLRRQRQRGPNLGVAAQAQQIAEECVRGDEILAALSVALGEPALEHPVLDRSGDEWAQSFLARSTDVPDDASSLQAEVEFEFPRRHQSRTVVQAIVRVADRTARDAEPSSRRLILDGEVLRRDELFESFRYRFDQPAAAVAADMPLVAERFLRPGTYTLILRVQDLESGSFFRDRQEIQVPALAPKEAIGTDEIASSASSPRHSDPPPVAPNSSGARPSEPVRDDLVTTTGIATAEEVSGDRDCTIRLLPPPTELHTGPLRVTAHAEGKGIARVAFLLNDREVISKRRAPYNVEIDIGESPQPQRIGAQALTRDGEVLARDEIKVNAGPHCFSLRLVEPRRGATHVEFVRASAEVEVPSTERLDRVEVFLNEDLVATLYQAPFVQPITIPPGQELSYVRAVAHLEGGGTAEDFVFVNAPDMMEEIQVDLVELYTTAADRRGNLIDDLEVDDFEVLEDGKPQEIRRFERVRDLPIHACVVLDTSTSMSSYDRLDEAQEAAHHFFEQVLGPKDRACLIVFNDQPELVVPFNPSAEVLAGGLVDLEADGETALYDSLVYGLYQFGCIRGKRAIIVLTDGEDSNSSYRFDDLLEFAQRAEVAIYSIGLGLDRNQVHAQMRLNELCRETGGRCFFIDNARELHRVYEKIEQELRSQYLLAYQSPRIDDSSYREVQVEVEQKGVRAKTLRGYFP